VKDVNTKLFHSMLNAVEHLLHATPPSFGRTIDRAFLVMPAQLSELPDAERYVYSDTNPMPQSHTGLLVDVMAASLDTGVFRVEDSQCVLGYIIIKYRDDDRRPLALAINIWAHLL
jgi:hypothetical protein